jgi:dipeptidase
MTIAICFISALLFLLTLGARRSCACTTVIVGKRASATGEVLVGHNEDSDGPYVMRTHIVPPKLRAPGAKMRFEPSAALIDAPRRAAGMFWSEALSYLPGGASFCDFYVNSFGVVICSDNCGASMEDGPEISDGGIGYGLRRVVAETAQSARHAMEIASRLLDRYGYRGLGRSYHFADRDEAWVLQVVIGKRYAVSRIPDDEVYLNPNHFTIRRPGPETPRLDQLAQYAAERGWSGQPGDFDFARSYQAPENYRAVRNFHRHLRGMEMILGRELDADADLPFSVRPPRKIVVEDVKKILRSHFEGTESYVARGEAPHAMRTRPICDQSTLESCVVQIRENPADILIRRALGKPCIAPYIPWHLGVTSAPDAIGHCDPDDALSGHFAPAASDFSVANAGNAAWFLHTSVQTAADLLYPSSAKIAQTRVLELEKTLEDSLAAFENAASPAYDDFVSAALTQALSALGDVRAGLGVAELKSADFDAARSRVTVRVDAVDLPARNPRPDKFFLGMSRMPLSKWLAADRLELNSGEAAIEFQLDSEWDPYVVPCASEIWLAAEAPDLRRAWRGQVSFEAKL